MASGLQIKCATQIVQGGYPGEEIGIDRGYGNWADVGLSGSIESGYFYRDSDAMDNNNSSKVIVRIRDSWSGTINPVNNVITVTVSSAVISIDRVDASASAGNTLRDISVRSDWNGAWLWQYLNDPINTSHHIGSNINLGSTVFTLAPGTENGRGSVYYRNHSSGYPEEERYRDEFWMGIQVRNVLPAAPSAPIISTPAQVATTCTTLGATAQINVTASTATYPNLESYARYYANDTWSDWQTPPMMIMSDLPAGTTITMQSYSKQGQLVGPTNTQTFNTWNRPQPATVSVSRQWGSDDQTRVDLTFNFSQPDAIYYTNSTTYAKIKNGDDDWTDWIQIGTGTSGTYVLRSVDQGRHIGIKTYTVGDGLCSDERNFETTAFEQPEAPTFYTPTMSDTGACYTFSIPWVQTTASRYSSGETYLSYSINGGRWSPWARAADWTSGTFSTICLPYDAHVRIRAYSVGDNLRSTTSYYELTVPSESFDDTPYSGPLLMNDVLCASLMYLVELICQEWYAIKDDEREVYTNEDTKANCDGDEDDPTLHSILSRIYRYLQAMNCLVCSGLNDSFNHHKRGPANTVYISAGDGEYGQWTAPDTVVTEDSDNVVESGAVKSAINELVRSVYHFVGEWQYMVYDPTQLDDLLNKVAGDKAIVKIGDDGTNQEYVYDGTNWSAGDVLALDDFSLVHIDKASDFYTDYDLHVQIKAGSAWFWYNGNWNSLDANLDDLIADVDEQLAQNFVEKLSETEATPYVTVVQRNSDGTVTGLPTDGRKKVYFVTEDM